MNPSSLPLGRRCRVESPVRHREGLEKWLFGILGILPELTFRKKLSVDHVFALQLSLADISARSLLDLVAAVAKRISVEGFNRENAAVMYALIAIVCERKLGLRVHPCQLHGAWQLQTGKIIQMQTGEGKSLTALFASVTAAVTKIPVHIVTVNDYLAARDAAEFCEVYEAFGVSVASLVHDMSPQERRQAYDADVVYLSSKELVFDFLRDEIKLEERKGRLLHAALVSHGLNESELLQRGLHFAIIDEVDSVLIDEAGTPLIISEMVANAEEEVFRQAYSFSLGLKEGEDFTIDDRVRDVFLTESGEVHLDRVAGDGRALGKIKSRSREIVKKALYVNNILKRDVDYLVSNDKVELIDPLSGRVMEGRSWEGGVHQLVEIKESCPVSENRVTKTRISYQKFFGKYMQLAGMTATASAVSRELWRTYQTRVVDVAPHRKCRRIRCSPQVFLSESLWQNSVVERSIEMMQAGRAVLIGTASVRASEDFAHAFLQRGIPHVVLNAKHDTEESAIIAMAGQAGRVTIATNMAGRGTDIKLTDEVEKAGGLHAIMTAMYESARVDRQFEGRSARQGNAGSVERILYFSAGQKFDSLPVLKSFLTGKRSALSKPLLILVLRVRQKLAERRRYRMRKQAHEYDVNQAKMTSYAGSEI